jgi:hypothetical protein
VTVFRWNVGTRVGRGLGALVLALTATGLLPVQARAWGERAHKRVNAEAIENLPEPLRSYFEGRKFYLVENASKPDWLAAHSAAERRHHFVEVEAYDVFPFLTFQQQFVREGRGPTPAQLRHGDCVWQIELFTLKLAAALREHRWDEADEAALFLAHYATDLTQPLHTVVNYDGRLTNQAGLHHRFEVDLVNAHLNEWVFDPAPCVAEADLRGRIFRELLESYRHRHAVFEADRIAATGWTYVDSHYTATFAGQAGSVARKQLEAAISFVSSLWYTAWVRAGKPSMGRQPGTNQGKALVARRPGD